MRGELLRLSSQLILLTLSLATFAHEPDHSNCALLLSEPYTHQLKADEDPEVAYNQILLQFTSRGLPPPVTIRMTTPSDGRTCGIWNLGTRFIVTDRELAKLNELFSRGELDLAKLRGKKVFEAGTGERAILTNHLVASGVNARGIDLSLSRENLCRPYLIQGDMGRVEFPKESFDVIISSNTVFVGMYDGHDVAKVTYHLKRFYEWLTPGGLIHIAGFDSHVLVAAVDALGGGLIIADGPYLNDGGTGRTITLQKTFSPGK